MKNVLRKTWLGILDVLFPLQCLGCQKKGQLLCLDCQNKLALNQTLLCSRCRARLADNKKICHRDSPYLLAAAGDYRDPILRNLIWVLKYRRWQPAAKTIAAILRRYLISLNIDISKYRVVPIPLHPARQKERGFNQAELIAKELISLIGPIGLIGLISPLKRIKNNKPQVQISDWEKRKANIKDCFSVVNANAVKNQLLIILDDVSTSGATLEEAARVLKAAGAKRIIGLVLAKG